MIDEIENKTEVESLENIVDEVDISAENRKVVEVLGEHTLVFEEGQFFLEETRNPLQRKILSRNQAKEIFMEYKIKNLSARNEQIIE